MQVYFIYDCCPRLVHFAYHFTGKERDAESGLDYFGARYYASSMGRWMSPDWAENPEAVPYSKLSDPQSLNLYGYVGNNPLSRFDGDGHQPMTANLAKFNASEDKPNEFGYGTNACAMSPLCTSEAEANGQKAGPPDPPAPQHYGKQADGSYKANPAKVQSAIDAKTKIGVGQCVDSCSRLSGVTPHTDDWTPGRAATTLNDTTDIGLAIASFGKDNKYKQPGTDQNSAIYMGHDRYGRILVVDQWPNGDSNHDHPNLRPMDADRTGTGRIENNINSYHVIIVK